MRAKRGNAPLRSREEKKLKPAASATSARSGRPSLRPAGARKRRHTRFESLRPVRERRFDRGETLALEAWRFGDRGFDSARLAHRQREIETRLGAGPRAAQRRVERQRA